MSLDPSPTLAALREERKALEAELAAMQPLTNVITLHPGAVKHYLEMVNDLATSLSRRTIASIGGDLFPTLRGDIGGSGGPLRPFPPDRIYLCSRCSWVFRA